MTESGGILMYQLEADTLINKSDLEIRFDEHEHSCQMFLGVLKSGPGAGHAFYLIRQPKYISGTRCGILDDSLFCNCFVTVGELFDALDITDRGRVCVINIHGFLWLNDESMLYADKESVQFVWKLPSARSFGRRKYAVLPDGPFRTISAEEMFTAGAGEIIAKYHGEWRNFWCVRDGDTIHITLFGSDHVTFSLLQDDHEAIQSVRAELEDLRTARFQVRVSGIWFYVYRVGRSITSKGHICSVLGSRKIPELKETRPGPFEIEEEVEEEQIEAVRVLLSQSILDKFFDV